MNIRLEADIFLVAVDVVIYRFRCTGPALVIGKIDVCCYVNTSLDRLHRLYTVVSQSVGIYLSRIVIENQRRAG